MERNCQTKTNPQGCPLEACCCWQSSPGIPCVPGFPRNRDLEVFVWILSQNSNTAVKVVRECGRLSLLDWTSDAFRVIMKRLCDSVPKSPSSVQASELFHPYWTRKQSSPDHAETIPRASSTGFNQILCNIKKIQKSTQKFLLKHTHQISGSLIQLMAFQQFSHAESDPLHLQNLIHSFQLP